MSGKNERWEPVESLDYTRRVISDWEKIYGIVIKKDNFDDSRLFSEYEWAYCMCNMDYSPNNKNFEKLAVMELRAMELNRDIFMGATLQEREVLVNRYMETTWVRKRLNVLL
jgi:hypothetical protein